MPKIDPLPPFDLRAILVAWIRIAAIDHRAASFLLSQIRTSVAAPES
jgi:hypothetical protein